MKPGLKPSEIKKSSMSVSVSKVVADSDFLLDESDKDKRHPNLAAWRRLGARAWRESEELIYPGRFIWQLVGVLAT